MNSRKYLQLFNIVDSYIKVYNYGNKDKTFEIDENKLIFNSKNNDDVNKAEFLSMIFNIIRVLRIDVNLFVNDNKLNEFFDYLDVDYENSDKLEFNYDNKTIGKIKFDDNLNYEVSTKEIVNLMNIEIDDYLEVGVSFNTKEEQIKGLCLLQDLRFNGVICDKIENNNNCNVFIKLSEDDLSKGLIKVKDNVLEEEIDVPEDEIIEYIMGVI